MTSPFNHNKKRNSGLVYEFLVRRVALSMVDRDPESYLKAVGIIKRYYSPGAPLAREREVFDVVSRTRGASEAVARRVLEEVKAHVSSLDHRKIDIKKSNLIKDIHYTFGKDFFTVHRIPEYRLYASVQMLIEQYRNQATGISEGVRRIELEESLTKFMRSPAGSQDASPRGEKVDGLVAAMVVKKFEQRYSGALNEAQKKTLRRFMNFSMTGNREQFQREMEEDRTGILKKLEASRDLGCFSEDKVMGQRMDEALTALRGIQDVTSESAVQDVLLYHRLVQEIDSDE